MTRTGFALLAALIPGLLLAPGASAGTSVRTSAPARSVLGSGQPAFEGTSDYDWPLRPRPMVSRPFQPPSRPYGPGHRGADLNGRPGQPVLAAGAGVVLYAGQLADRGVVSVRHPDGLRTTYEPVAATVHPGQLVRRGDWLGSLVAGHPGCPVAACLHWGLLREQVYLDPLPLVRATPVRLLPWSG